MSEQFHYVRTVGDDGGVEACDGPAIGLDLESVLKDGLPPWKVALEIVAALCEILDIADEDGEDHGDLSPRDVFVDDTGAVSVEGFEVERRQSRAPEGSPKGGATDLYGLGLVAYRLFCSAPLPQLPNDDPDAHDDAVIDAVLLVDLEGVPEEMQGDIQWFLAKLLSFDREDRPSAVEAWRTFIAFADATVGPDFVAWCAAAIDGGGERRKEAGAPKPAGGSTGAAPAPADDEDEDLGGPVMRSGPLTKGAINFDTGGAPKGQATAFWSRDAMKAALEREDDEDDAYRPQAGGGSATAFWSKAEMAAMREGGNAAPRPKRSSKRSETMMMAMPRKGGGGPSPEPDTRPPVAQAPPSPPQQRPHAAPQRPAPPSPPQQPAPPPQAAPIAQGPRASSPGAAPIGAHPMDQGPVPIPPPPTPLPPEEGGGSKMLLVGGVLAVVLIATLVCLGVGGAGGAWVLLGVGEVEGPVVEATPPAPAPAPSATKDTDAGEDEKVEEASPKPAPSPKPRPRPSPKPTSSPKPRPAPVATAPRPAPVPKPPPLPAPKAEPEPEPAPAPASGPARVSFGTSGRGTLSCAGSSKDFDGPTTVTIEAYQLPATCLVTMDGGRGVFQVFASGAVTCNLAGSTVECDKMAVQ